MSTSIRISNTGKSQPAGGIIGAFGGTTPGGSQDVVLDTDDLEGVDDIVAFLERGVGPAVQAFGRTFLYTEEPDVDESESKEDPEHDDSTVFYRGQEFTAAQWAAVEAYAKGEVEGAQP